MSGLRRGWKKDFEVTSTLRNENRQPIVLFLLGWAKEVVCVWEIPRERLNIEQPSRYIFN